MLKNFTDVVMLRLMVRTFFTNVISPVAVTAVPFTFHVQPEQALVGAWSTLLPVTNTLAVTT